MSSPLYVTAQFTVKAQGLQAMLEVLAVLSRHTRLEPGCLDYGYFQSLHDPLQLTSFETWQSEAAEARHWQSAHLLAALAQAEGLLLGAPQVSRYRRVC